MSSKSRKLFDSKMLGNSCVNDWMDLRPTRRSKFSTKKFSNIVRSTPINYNSDIIDLSSDDDDIDYTPRKSSKRTLRHSNTPSLSMSTSPTENVFRDAKKTMNSYNILFNEQCKKKNDTFRLQEQQLYRDLLLSSPTTAEAYESPINKHQFYSEARRSSKILSMLKEKNNVPLIDLTNDKSRKSNNDTIVIKDDSDADITNSKKTISPVNSLKKILDTEPFMDPNYVSKLDTLRRNQRLETERLIAEEWLKREKFSSLNRENIHTLLEEKFKNCRITRHIILDDYEETLTFPVFTPEQESKINEALNSRNLNKVYIEKYNLRITGQDLKLFNEVEWLNDEVINFYVNMIQERSENHSNLPKVYSFSTFFYPKLIKTGYSSLRRWTKRVDLFSYDIIVVPIHLGFHWCMAIIDFNDKSIRYYDSMFGKNMQCLQALENYLKEEHKDKKKTDYNMSNWNKIIMSDIPRQMNGSDCGVFSCTFAEFITRKAKILFTQEHMPYIRRKMALEIMEGRLLT